NAEGHPCELTVQLRDHLANSFGGASARRNDVLQDSTTAAPILLGGTIHRLLGSSRSMYRGHEATLDAEVVVEYLGDRRQTIGGARRVRDIGLSSVAAVVDAHDEHGGVIFGGSRHDYLLSASLDVTVCAVLTEENARCFDNDFSTDFAPLELGRIRLSRYADGLAVHHEGTILHRDITLKTAMHGVILEHVRKVI